MRRQIDRFDEMTMPEPNTGCVFWLGTEDSHGYGQMWNGVKLVKAHRVAWERANGRIPKGTGHHGFVVMHRCDMRLCVNPDHLMLGTQADNLSDMRRKGRGRCIPAERCAAKTHCPRGHEYSAENVRVYQTRDGRRLRNCRECAREATRQWRASRKAGITVP